MKTPSGKEEQAIEKTIFDIELGSPDFGIFLHFAAGIDVIDVSDIYYLTWPITYACSS